MKIHVSQSGERGERAAEVVREREEVGGVSVQFTNTTVNSEAGQDTERVGGGVRKRLLVQECH